MTKTSGCRWVGVFLFVFLCLKGCHSAVIGIDFGSDNIKLAIVAPGKPFSIVVDEVTKRKWPGVVAFGDDTREFGNNAKSTITKKPAASFRFLQHALGRNAASSAVKEFKENYLPFKFTRDNARGVVEVRFDENTNYQVEELVGMIFQHVRRLAATENEGSAVRDCVITVPDYFAQTQRQAILDAAAVAGLNVLSLINENSAAALQYGVGMDYETDTVKYVAFYNMGSSSTKVSIVRYSTFPLVVSKNVKKGTKEIGQFEVVAQAWDETLGGRAFTKRLVELLLREAEPLLREEGLENPRSEPRVMARLYARADKAKVVLSANKETYVSVEGIYRDVDFQTTVTREQFERSCEGLFERVVAPLTDAIRSSGLTKDELDSLVLVGGGVRVPRIKDMLRDFMGQELRKDLNGDEAPALGAAFRAANVSGSFRVRPIGMVDISPFPVDVSIYSSGADGLSKRGNLFEAGGKLKRRKSVVLQYGGDFKVSLYYPKSANLPRGTSQAIAVYRVKADSRLSRGEVTPSVALQFTMDGSSMVQLTKAVATVKGSDEKANLSITRLPVDVRGYSESDLEDSRAVLEALDEKDNAVRRLATSKNDLEGYIYETRAFINDDDNFQEMFSDSEREGFLKTLSDAEDWIWDDESPDTVEKFRLKLDLVKGAVGSQLQQAKDVPRRPEALDKGAEVIEKARKLVKGLRRKEKASEGQIDKLSKLIGNTETFLKESKAAQEELTLRDTPAFTSRQVYDKLNVLSRYAEDLRTKAVVNGLKEKKYPKFKTEL